jgi:hypothetical protein
MLSCHRQTLNVQRFAVLDYVGREGCDALSDGGQHQKEQKKKQTKIMNTLVSGSFTRVFPFPHIESGSFTRVFSFPHIEVGGTYRYPAGQVHNTCYAFTSRMHIARCRQSFVP